MNLHQLLICVSRKQNVWSATGQILFKSLISLLSAVLKIALIGPKRASSHFAACTECLLSLQPMKKNSVINVSFLAPTTCTISGATRVLVCCGDRLFPQSSCSYCFLSGCPRPLCKSITFLEMQTAAQKKTNCCVQSILSLSSCPESIALKMGSKGIKFISSSRINFGHLYSAQC